MQAQILNRYLGQLADLLVCDLWVLVEKKEYEHLVGRDLEFIPGLRVEFGLEICSTETKLPVELFAVVKLVEIELGEAAH